MIEFRRRSFRHQHHHRACSYHLFSSIALRRVFALLVSFFFNRPFFFALVCSPVFCPASAVLGPVHNRDGGGGEGDHEFNILIPPAKMMQVKWYFYSALVPCCGIDTCLQRRNLHHL